MLGLIGEALIALPHAVVGDQRLDLAIGELLEIGFAVVARIRQDGGVLGEDGFDLLNDRHQHFLLRTRAVRLGADDDLMLAIDRRHPGVALDDAFAGGHLRAVVVGAIALANRGLTLASLGTTAILRILD